MVRYLRINKAEHSSLWSMGVGQWQRQASTCTVGLFRDGRNNAIYSVASQTAVEKESRIAKLLKKGFNPRRQQISFGLQENYSPQGLQPFGDLNHTTSRCNPKIIPLSHGDPSPNGLRCRWLICCSEIVEMRLVPKSVKSVHITSPVFMPSGPEQRLESPAYTSSMIRRGTKGNQD